MDLESSDLILSTDKKYFFLETKKEEGDGFMVLRDLFFQLDKQDFFGLGTDPDQKYWLLPAQLLTFKSNGE